MCEYISDTCQSKFDFCPQSNLRFNVSRKMKPHPFNSHVPYNKNDPTHDKYVFIVSPMNKSLSLSLSLYICIYIYILFSR